MSEQIEKEIAEIEKQLDNPPLFDLSNVSREELEAFIQYNATCACSGDFPNVKMAISLRDSNLERLFEKKLDLKNELKKLK